MELKNMDTDYENQRFDELDVNPYEIVIAVSKKAREINSKAIKYLGQEVEIRPINIVLNNLLNDDVEFNYVNQGRKNETQKSSPAGTGKSTQPESEEKSGSASEPK